MQINWLIFFWNLSFFLNLIGFCILICEQTLVVTVCWLVFFPLSESFRQSLGRAADSDGQTRLG